MEIMSLTLFGKPFADCFTISQDIRITRDMKDEACLTYIDHGIQELFSPTKKIRLKDKESLLMKCGNYVANTHNISPISQLSGIVFHLNPDSIKAAFGDKDLDFLNIEERITPTNPAIELGQNDLIESFVNSLRPYFNKPKLSSEKLMAIKLQELITILTLEGNDHILYLLGTIRKREIFEFETIINANLYNNLSVPELAHLMNKSESSFKREFKKYYNESPARYLKTKKLEKAAELLKNSSKSISKISWECGFEDLAHFSSSFNNIYKLSPRKYRSSILID
ncbi:MAG: AraC-like DNA-binding protein [Polaribacter sp.]|jgi:AraC-like DNA-binding protein